MAASSNRLVAKSVARICPSRGAAHARRTPQAGSAWFDVDMMIPSRSANSRRPAIVRLAVRMVRAETRESVVVGAGLGVPLAAAPRAELPPDPLIGRALGRLFLWEQADLDSRHQGA